MVKLAEIFFWLHTGLCVTYLCWAGRAAVRSLRGGLNALPKSFQLGDMLVLSNDKVVDGMTYLVLGLFLLYAEIYMYRVYCMATAFSL